MNLREKYIRFCCFLKSLISVNKEKQQQQQQLKIKRRQENAKLVHFNSKASVTPINKKKNWH